MKFLTFLFISVEKPSFSVKPQNTLAKDLENIEVETIVKGLPRPTLKWYIGSIEMDQKTLDSENRFLISTSNVDDSTIKSTFKISTFTTTDETKVYILKKLFK